MGLQEIIGGRVKCQYEKLNSMNEKVGRPGRQQWVKKMDGRLKGLRLSRWRKLTLKAFSFMFPSRIAKIYIEIVKRMKIDYVYPSIIFSTQLGLPVLSHNSSVKRRRNVLMY